MSRLSRPLFAVVVLLACGWSASPQPSSAQTGAAADPARPPSQEAEPIATDIHEEIARVPVTLTLGNGRAFNGNMIVTHFRPDGAGPFPVVVFSHGRSSASRHEPDRWRVLPLARYWVRRGFAVMVPTRVGYGETGQSVDPEASGTCVNADYRPAVAAMATQVSRAVTFAGTLPWVDRNRVLLTGVSYGGFATIGAVALDIPGVVGAINFVGGLGGNPQHRPGDPCQGQRTAEIAADAGKRSRAPMLWLYADNDRYWGSEWPQRWYDAFTSAGGSAKLASFAAIGDDGHRLMSAGFRHWRPVVDKFVSGLGFQLPKADSRLPATDHARIEEADKVPFIDPAAREQGYDRFLAADVPRAFALAPSGSWAWQRGHNAAELALNRCQGRAATRCVLYAVDDRVVWKPGRP